MTDLERKAAARAAAHGVLRSIRRQKSRLFREKRRATHVRIHPHDWRFIVGYGGSEGVSYRGPDGVERVWGLVVDRDESAIDGPVVEAREVALR